MEPGASCRVWLANLFFGPGLAPTGVLLESLAVHLADRGYRVEVMTGRTAYATGAAGRAGRFRGRVHRLYSGPRRAAGGLGRFLAWAAFLLSAMWFVFTRPLPALVVVMTTPPWLHGVVAFRNLFARRPAALVLWNQDTYPEVLAAVGLTRRTSLAYRAMAAVERWAARRVTLVVALDGAMAAVLRDHGARRVEVTPNWECGPDPAPASNVAPDPLAATRGSARFLVLYTGNYGWGHDLRPLADWLRANPGQRDFSFLFVGGGEKWRELERLAADFPTAVATHRYLPWARLQSLIRAADFGLVTLAPDCLGLMAPSKIHAYLAAGKPLVYLGPPGSNVAEAIDRAGCGARAGYETPDALARALAVLAGPHFDLAAAGARAAAAARAWYTEPAAPEALVRLIETALPTRPPTG